MMPGVEGVHNKEELPMKEAGTGKMRGFAALVLLTVFSAFLGEAEANYERLRIGGIIFTVLLVIGAFFVLFRKVTKRPVRSKLLRTRPPVSAFGFEIMGVFQYVAG
ncbi:hypothetical protein NFI96_018623 [Prochilodus magdalenae]|nr:hypothetical protein NFI96_018623 [Prochilodus magdalenae]